MSAKQSNCSLHEILQTPCGSSRDKESHVFLSECNADISAHLLSCHLSKCGDVTEAGLIMARAGIRAMSATQITRITICPRHRHSLGRFWRAPKSCQYPGHTGKVTSFFLIYTLVIRNFTPVLGPEKVKIGVGWVGERFVRHPKAVCLNSPCTF